MVQKLMSSGAPKRRKKSTNVRSAGFKAMGMTMRVIESVSAEAAAGFALHVMFRQVRKFERPDWEKQVIATADDRFRLQWRDGYLACWSWGEGPTVLLVHGWEGRGSQMGRFVEPLVAAGYRVVAFDGPAHGDSTTSRGSMPDHLAAVERVVEHLGPIEAVIGHSMGAIAITIAAARGLESRFVLVSPPSDPRDYFDAAQKMIGFSANTKERLLEKAEVVVGFRFDELNGPSRAREIESPALIVHDRSDREVELHHAEAIQANWANSQLLITEGLGHRRILKDATVIRRAVEFVRAHEPVRGAA